MRWRTVKRGLAGAGMEWARGAGERRRPTHGRQDKSADLRRAHVVGWIGLFFTSPQYACWRLRQNIQRIQHSERRRLRLPRLGQL